MIYNVNFKDLKEGRLDSRNTSKILAQVMQNSQSDWQQLKMAIQNSDHKSISESGAYIQEIADYFQFDTVTEYKRVIEEKANQGIYDLHLYQKMLTDWTKQICNLRTKFLFMRQVNALQIAG